MNYSKEVKKINLYDHVYQDLLTDQPVKGSISLEGLDVRVLKK